MLEVAVVALLVNSGVSALMIGLIMSRKAKRDRVEEASRDRRARFLRSVSAGRPGGLLTTFASAREPSHWADLDYALDRAADGLSGQRYDEVRAAARDAGLIETLLRATTSRSPTRRALAGQLLARLGPIECYGVLDRLARDRDIDVRLTAVRGLAVLGDRPAAKRLVSTLAERLVPPERVVERLSEPWALRPVLEALEVTPPGHHTRPKLAQALGLLGDRRAEGALNGLLTSTHLEERVSAARALGKARAVTSLPALIAAASDDAWEVRAQACRALGLIGSDRAVDVLMARLDDRAWWVRAAAAGSLSQLGPAGLDALRSAARSHPDRYARDRAREELALVDVGGVACAS